MTVLLRRVRLGLRGPVVDVRLADGGDLAPRELRDVPIVATVMGGRPTYTEAR
jgi:hypothetical protein